MPHDKLHNIEDSDHIASSGKANYLIAINNASSTSVATPYVSSQLYSTSGTFNVSVLAPFSVYLCDADTGNITLNLPSTSGETRMLSFKKIDSSANTVTLSARTSQTVENSSTFIMTTQYQAVSLISNLTSAYYII